MTALAIPSTSTLVAFRPLPLAAIEELFERLMGMLGNKVERAFGEADPETIKQEWSSTLAGFRGRELQRGLEAMRLRRFVPNSGEFAQLCRPALDAEYAWYEAQDGLKARDLGQMGEWSHPAVYRAAITMGGLGINVRTGSFKQSRRRWEMVLSREFASGWGDEVPEPTLRIKNTPTLRDIPSDVRERLSGLTKKFSGR